MRRGIDLSEFNRRWTDAGGTIERDTRSHILYRATGFKVYGLHCNAESAPGRLVSLLRKVEAGAAPFAREVVVAEPEQLEPVAAERHRFIQRPNPSYTISVSPQAPETVLEMVERLGREKQAQRDAAALLPKPAPVASTSTPYVSQEADVVFNAENHRSRPLPAGRARYVSALRLLNHTFEIDRAQMEAGDHAIRTVAWFDTREEWEAALRSMGWDPCGGFTQTLEGLSKAVAQDREREGLPPSAAPWTPTEFCIAVGRPRYGVEVSTTNFLPSVDSIACLSTVDAPTYARFMAGWDQGVDHERRQARRYKDSMEQRNDAVTRDEFIKSLIGATT